MNKYLNCRYVPNIKNLKTYINHNGVFKEFKTGIFSRKLLSQDKLFYLFSDLPEKTQTEYEDMAISDEEIVPKRIKIDQGKQYVIDDNGTKIFINDNTPLLPVVGKFLPSDGLNAYYVSYENTNLVLVPILICFNCHWSDLYTGNTKYGKNVFCLVSDIDKSKMDNYIGSIITLKEVPNFLGKDNRLKSKTY
jgi:hypothetical protein